MALLTAKKRVNTNTLSAFKAVVLVSLLTGTLDGAAALALNYKLNPAVIFRFIASGAFGKAAFQGGSEMVVSGIFFHYIIAFLFTTVFYQLYPVFKAAFKNKFVICVFFGVFAWVIMNLAVVPFSKIGYHPIKVSNIISGMAVLVLCLGLPVALIADWQYTKTLKLKK